MKKLMGIALLTLLAVISHTAFGMDKAQARRAMVAAAGSGRLDLIQDYLDEGIGIEAHVGNISADEGDTPLTAAAANGQDEAVIYLIKKGADIINTSSKSWTAMMLARENGHKDLATLLENVEELKEEDASWESIIQLLDEYLAKDNDRKRLIKAASQGDLDRVKYYLEEKEVPIGTRITTLESGESYTPLSAAAANGQDEVVIYLIKAGVNLNPLNYPKDQDPLTLAKKNGHNELATFLKKYEESNNWRLSKQLLQEYSEAAGRKKAAEEALNKPALERMAKIESIANELREAALALNINKIYELADQLINIQQKGIDSATE